LRRIYGFVPVAMVFSESRCDSCYHYYQYDDYRYSYSHASRVDDCHRLKTTHSISWMDYYFQETLAHRWWKTWVDLERTRRILLHYSSAVTMTVTVKDLAPSQAPDDSLWVLMSWIDSPPRLLKTKW
jgi:hypothetical protein